MGGGKKREKKHFQKHTYIARKKGGKKSTGKSAKYVFYKHTNIVIKKRGEKTRKIIFKKHTIRVCKNCWKKIVWKKCENTFVYKHTNIVTKKTEENNARKIFSKNTRIGYPKIVGKKSSQKSSKTRFL